MWTSYRVTLLFLTKLCASVPSDPELIRKWLEARRPKVAVAPGGKSINEIQEEVLDTLAYPDDEPPPQRLIFQRFNGSLVVRAATFRAHLKDCARVLSAEYIGKIQGDRSFSTRVINGVYHDEREYWLPILRPEGGAVREADGVMDKAIHVRDPRTGAPLSALKSFEFVDPARIDITLKILTAKPTAARKAKPKDGEVAKMVPLSSVSQEDLETLLMYGGTHGYAGERGDGEGRYTFTIEELK